MGARGPARHRSPVAERLGDSPALDPREPLGPGSAPVRILDSTSSDRRLLAWSSLTFLSRVVARLAQLLFLVAAARLLTLNEFATYSYLVVLAVTFSMLGATGVGLAASRDVSSGRTDPATAFWSALPVTAVGSLLAAFTLLLFAAFDSGPGSAPHLLALVAGFVVANIFYSFSMTMLRGVGRFGVEAALQLASGLSFLVAGVGAAVAGLGITGVLAALFARELAVALLAFWYLRPDLAPAERSRFRQWRTLFRVGIRLAVASMALAVATRSQLIILGNVGSNADVAWFSGPSRIADAVLVFSLTAGYSLLPGLSHIAASDRDRARRLLLRVLVTVTGALAVAGALGALLSTQIVVILFGHDFESAAEPARVFFAGLPFYAALGIAWYALLAVDAERPLMAIAGLAAVASVVAGLIVIPDGSDMGAAWVYVVTLALMAVGCLVVLRRKLGQVAAPSQSEAELATT
jgi:O-antigen/teichoic acid export membrane protein